MFKGNNGVHRATSRVTQRSRYGNLLARQLYMPERRGVLSNDYEKYKNTVLLVRNIILCIISETGGLFMLAIRLMQLFSENRSDFTKLAGILGLYFQIRDDYMNLVSKDVRFIVLLHFTSWKTKTYIISCVLSLRRHTIHSFISRFVSSSQL